MPRNERIGWLMFSLSGVIFLGMGIRDESVPTIIASLLWLGGCGLFLQSR